MNKSAALFISVILLTQIASYSLKEVQSQADWEVSIRNNTGGDTTSENGAQVWSAPVSLDSTGVVGSYSSLAIDSNDDLHVTYHDETNGYLEYVTYDGSSWSTPVTIGARYQANVGSYYSLAIDYNNDLHVTYFDSTNGNLEYTTCYEDENPRDSNDFSPYGTPLDFYCSASITLDHRYPIQSSLAIDSNDNLHVTYVDWTTNFDLMYMKYDNSTSSWSTPFSIDSAGNVGEYSSLAIDSNDHLHVTYYDKTNSSLDYMKYDNSTSSWSAPVTLDNTDDVGRFSSLAIDSNNDCM